MRVLVFGASTVQGYWDSQGGWAERLRDYYDKRQLEAFNRGDFTHEEPKVMNLGISGDGIVELLKRIGPESQARQNDKGVSFVISIGTNSAAIMNGKEVTTTKEFKNDLRKAIGIAKEYSNKIMLVGLPAVNEAKTNPIPWADMYFKNGRIGEFEAAALELAKEQGLLFVPVHEKFQNKVEASERLQSHDGLHPNDAGHQLIFELVLPCLDGLLNT